MYEPRVGDYGLVQTKGFFGFLIQLGTFSKVNHAFIYEGDGIIIEAKPRQGVTRSPVSDYEGIIWNKWEELTDSQREAIVDFAALQVGKKYFFGDIAVIAARILRIPVPKIILKRIAHEGGIREICSDMATRCYRNAGVEIEPAKPAYFVTPSDLLYRQFNL